MLERVNCDEPANIEISASNVKALTPMFNRSTSCVRI